MEEMIQEPLDNKKTINIVPFVTGIARYFMEFLQTDFHRIKNPKRQILNRDSNNLQIGINLQKYPKYKSLAWKVIRSGFENDALNELKRGIHTNSIPESLLSLILSQIKAIDEKTITKQLHLFQLEIELGVKKNPNDSMAALSFALDGIRRQMRESFLAIFIDKIKEPLEKLKNNSLDSIYQIEEELSDILMKPFEDSVSLIINQLYLQQEIPINKHLKEIFALQEIQGKLISFFQGFAIGDLFYEISELVNNKNILDKQEFYFYFGELHYKDHRYPLFYIPVHIEKSDLGFSLQFDSLLYANKKAIQFISQDLNTKTERKGKLSSFIERIIYLSEKDVRQHLIGEIDKAFKEVTSYFTLLPYLDLNNPETQIARNPDLQLSNNCFFALFDKADESLINDYEEILFKLQEGDDNLAEAFQKLIDNFLTQNPISLAHEVEKGWDEQSSPEKLVYSSPVPLNEEQRQILLALKHPDCKYLAVEGPPGTGKSHTITAIVCEAILNSQSVLVLSDKKEALDVVEDKITEAINKVRLDKHFQNPILRLGKSGNTYAKILSTTSMERIKEHYKAVRNDYKKLEFNKGNAITNLKEEISTSISSYQKISMQEIIEFLKLESHYLQENTIIDIEELEGNLKATDDLLNLRLSMLRLRELLLNSKTNLSNLFRHFFPNDFSINAFNHFVNFLGVAHNLKTSLGKNLLIAKKIPTLSREKIAILQKYISDISALKSPLFGYFFKKNELNKLNTALFSSLAHTVEEPHYQLTSLKSVVSSFLETEQQKHGLELSKNFQWKDDFIASVHQIISLDLEIPSQEDLKIILETVNHIQLLLMKYPGTTKKLAIDTNHLFSLIDNKLNLYPEEDLDKLLYFLGLKAELESYFKAIPKDNYSTEKKIIEELVTTEMTYKMDERVIDFFENHRNDAKTLVGVISKKQRFDKQSFAKLKKSFPCILAGIRDYAEFIPLESEIFDLIIIDEASQVSIAQAFPALLRAKKIIVLGDRMQFSNVKASHARSDTNREYLNLLKTVFVNTISSENAMLERLEKFNIKTSILDFFERIANFHIMLRKHFRGYRELISYSSKYFYDEMLQAIKIRIKPIEQVIQFTFIEHDKRLELIENTNLLEIDALKTEIERIAKEEPHASIGIITPHTNQQKLLAETFAKHPNAELFYTQHRLKIMTFDTCQGEERDIILYSMVANPAADKLWGIFIKDRQGVDFEEGGRIKLQRLNVGFSRAKERIHFFLSKPLDNYTGSIAEALRHYQRTLDESLEMPDARDTDALSPMEKKILHWLQETSFFKANAKALEIKPQFPLGLYIKQLDKRYSHPAYVVDFLLVFTDATNKQHSLIIEYDGFDYHFENEESIDAQNYNEYYTEEDIYRQKILESYGYNFLRINRFNLGKKPAETLDSRLQQFFKYKAQSNPVVSEIHEKIDGLQKGSMKECPQCKNLKPLSEFKDEKLISKYGRLCMSCKKPNPKCPLCNAPMVLRQRKTDGHQFYGCTRYPACKGTKKY